MADVFISYDHRDRSKAQSLADYLSRFGYTCWWDRELLVGSEFAKTIAREITASSAVVVIWSKFANESNWVRDEADEAMRAGKLVPVTFDGSLPPLGFRQILAVELADTLADSDCEYTRLNEAISLLASQPTDKSARKKRKHIKQDSVAALLRTNMDSGLAERIRLNAPKRILTIDGGGVRTIIGMMFLKKLEAVLSKNSDNPESFRLCHYFDLIAGSSHGSIIASLLATGHQVDEIIEYSIDGFRDIFGGFLPLTRAALFPSQTKNKLESHIFNALGDIRLGGSELKTGLAIFAKRIDTNTTWIITNSPFSQFYDPPPGLTHTKPTKDMRLADFAIAGISFPPFFRSQTIEIAKEHESTFVDGFLGPYACPALGTFLAIQSPTYGFNWQLGPDNVAIYSVGSGTNIYSPKLKKKNPKRLLEAAYTFGGIAIETSEFGHNLMQSLGQQHPVNPSHAQHNSIAPSSNSKKLFRYTRYDVKFTSAWVNENCGLSYSDKDLERIARFYRIDDIDELMTIGNAAANRQVDFSA